MFRLSTHFIQFDFQKCLTVLVNNFYLFHFSGTKTFISFQTCGASITSQADLTHLGSAPPHLQGHEEVTINTTLFACVVYCMSVVGGGYFSHLNVVYVTGLPSLPL